MGDDSRQFLYRLAVLICISLIIIAILYFSIHSPPVEGSMMSGTWRYIYLIQFGIDLAIFYMMAESWLWGGKPSHV